MMNKSNALADRLGMDVPYLGVNGVGQHLFGNGTMLVTDIFDTLEAAVARFGKRIKIDERAHRLSAYYREGYAAQKYQPRAGMNRLEKIEYGSGYLKRLIEQHEKAQAALPPKKEPDTRLPHEVLADRAKAAKQPAPVAKSVMAESIANIAKRRGRPPKSETPAAPTPPAQVSGEEFV